MALASVATGLVGSFLGALAGYLGGWVDGVVMRTMDLFLAFPYLLLALVRRRPLGPGILNTIVAIAVWTVPAFARVARSAVLQLKERDFVTAAISLGAKEARIMGVHLLPNFAATLVVYASLYLAYAILMESALSFLGLGVQPPTASWAGMIASGRNYVTSAPHIATIPGHRDRRRGPRLQPARRRPARRPRPTQRQALTRRSTAVHPAGAAATRPRGSGSPPSRLAGRQRVARVHERPPADARQRHRAHGRQADEERDAAADPGHALDDPERQRDVEAAEGGQPHGPAGPGRERPAGERARVSGGRARARARCAKPRAAQPVPTATTPSASTRSVAGMSTIVNAMITAATDPTRNTSTPSEAATGKWRPAASAIVASRRGAQRAQAAASAAVANACSSTRHTPPPRSRGRPGGQPEPERDLALDERVGVPLERRARAQVTLDRGPRAQPQLAARRQHVAHDQAVDRQDAAQEQHGAVGARAGRQQHLAAGDQQRARLPGAVDDHVVIGPDPGDAEQRVVAAGEQQRDEREPGRQSGRATASRRRPTRGRGHTMTTSSTRKAGRATPFTSATWRSNGTPAAAQRSASAVARKVAVHAEAATPSAACRPMVSGVERSAHTAKVTTV